MASRFVLASTTIARGAFVVGRQTAAFSTTRFMGLKESANHAETDHEKHKQDSLHKQKQGKGHWKPELASDSEEAVKADRSTEGVDPKTLAERTKKAAEETSKAGTSMREGL
ncbi:hypothetical protein CcaCcLH18_00324 [Colletotrichum camelliae]|nr:hypothetical protein CcaCcLH18_00324 [Colletotrichum camelliae]